MLAANSLTEGTGLGIYIFGLYDGTEGTMSSYRSNIEKFYFGRGGGGALTAYFRAGFGLIILGIAGLNDVGGFAIGFIFDY